MRLVRYLDPESGRVRLGQVQGEDVVELALTGSNGGGGFGGMRDVLARWNERTVDQQPPPETTRYPLSELRLLAPLPDPPGNVICLGRNYAEHAVESARARGEAVDRPTFFSKAISSIIGPHDNIPYDPELSRELDWEVELAVVIGRAARNVARERALDHVFGYMVLNDVSARDIQYGYGGQFFFGKSLDGSCPTGPWIVTADEVPDPQQLRLRLTVDGVVKQDDSTANMIFDVRECIMLLSRGMTLLPGQIIATGTPAGVGFSRTPPEYLQPDNVVESEIEGIGALRNRVVRVS